MTDEAQAAAVFVEDVRALFGDRDQLHANAERAFRLALPIELREAFTNPPIGTRAAAVVAAMFAAVDMVAEFAIGAIDAATETQPAAPTPTRFPRSEDDGGGDYDDDFREPIRKG